MKVNPIKQARQRRVMTQAEVADALGVTQSTYQRWESGSVSITAKNLERLADVLRTSKQALLGKPEPFDLFGIDPDVADDRSYYGEVSIRFAGSEQSLLLPISEAERMELLSALDVPSSLRDAPIMMVRSLDNRTVYLNLDAIVDLHFSSEAYDDVGPDEYGDYLPPVPDDEFWRMVECLANDGEGEEEFNEQALDALSDQIELSEEKVDLLIATGTVDAAERANLLKAAKEKTELFHRLATELRWQMRGGLVRSVDYFEADSILGALSNLLMEDAEMSYLILPIEGSDRTVAINLSQLDFLSVPTHKLREAELEHCRELLGET